LQDHWSLRSAAAEVIAIIGAKYRYVCMVVLCVRPTHLNALLVIII
jgi:hypothetical protein